MFRLHALLLVTLLAQASGAQFTYDARIEGDLSLHQVCEDRVVPVLKIRNSGTATMHGCVVETWKNGLVQSSFDWQLAVPALTGQVRQPIFPEVMDVVEGDVIEMRIISVNGFADEDPEGNIHSFTVGMEAVQAPSFLVEIRISSSVLAELDWYIRDANGTVVATASDVVVAPSEDVLVWAELAPATCYSVEVSDVAGFTGGTFTVRSGSEEVVTLTGDDVAAGMRPGFRTGIVAGIPVTTSSAPPALAWSADTRELRSLKEGRGWVRLLDAAGRVVYQGAMDADSPLNLEHIAPGIYLAAHRDASDRSSILRFTR
ncbi:MAG: hypothetical protein JNM62_09940 [Flavobacteriales bacterium]|nr:hypothetical protein [Flavobacteriales bacterium]